MKKAGFPAEKAASVEVAASTNGQLRPPVMGAAHLLLLSFGDYLIPGWFIHLRRLFPCRWV